MRKLLSVPILVSLLLLCLPILADSPRDYPYSHLPNTVRVVNFWATWCQACKVELKEFEKDLDSKKVNLILINLDSDPNAGKRWLKDNYKGEYTFVEDPEYKIAESLKLSSFPTTFVVDKSNRIVYEQKGFEEGKSTVKLLDALKSLK